MEPVGEKSLEQTPLTEIKQESATLEEQHQMEESKQDINQSVLNVEETQGIVLPPKSKSEGDEVPVKISEELITLEDQEIAGYFFPMENVNQELVVETPLEPTPLTEIKQEVPTVETQHQMEESCIQDIKQSILNVEETQGIVLSPKSKSEGQEVPVKISTELITLEDQEIVGYFFPMENVNQEPVSPTVQTLMEQAPPTEMKQKSSTSEERRQIEESCIQDINKSISNDKETLGIVLPAESSEGGEFPTGIITELITSEKQEIAGFPVEDVKQVSFADQTMMQKAPLQAPGSPAVQTLMEQSPLQEPGSPAVQTLMEQAPLTEMTQKSTTSEQQCQIEERCIQDANKSISNDVATQNIILPQTSKSESDEFSAGMKEELGTTFTSIPVIEQVRVRLEELKLGDNENNGTTPAEGRRSTSPLVSNWIAALPNNLLEALNTSIIATEKKGTDSSDINNSSECGSSTTTATTSIETSFLNAPQILNADSSNSSSNESDDTVVLDDSPSNSSVNKSDDVIVLNNSQSVSSVLNNSANISNSNESSDTVVLDNSHSVISALNNTVTVDSNNSIGNEANDTFVLNNSGSATLESEMTVDIVPDALNAAINKICDNTVEPLNLSNPNFPETEKVAIAPEILAQQNFASNDNSQNVSDFEQRRKSTGELDQVDPINPLKDQKLNTSNFSTDSDNSNTDNTTAIFTPIMLSPNIPDIKNNVNHELVCELVSDFIEKLPINCASDTNIVSPRGDGEDNETTLVFSSNSHGDNVNSYNSDNVSDSLVAREKREYSYYSKLLKLAKEIRQEETPSPPGNSEATWKWTPLVEPALPYDLNWMQDFATVNSEENSLHKILYKDFDSNNPLETSYFLKLLKLANFTLQEKFKLHSQKEEDHKTQELEPSEYKDILKLSHQILFEEAKKKRVRKVLDILKLTKELSNANNSQTNRSPLIKLENVDKKINKDTAETGTKPEAVIGKENVNTGVAAGQQYDLSIFSDSPAKTACRRDSIFRLFDPLYEKVFVKDPSLPSPESLLKGSKTLKPVLTPKGRQSGIIIPDDYEKQLNDVYFKVYTQIKDVLHEDPALDLDLTELPSTIKVVKTRMDDAIEDKMKMEQELNQLKLDINQLQQERTSLELELHQKDEVILKTQGEAQKKSSQFKQEIKTLQDKLTTLAEVESNDEVQVLNQQIETHKQTESVLNGKIGELKDKIVAFENIMREYEDMIGKIVPESEKLKIEHDTAKRHLATLEIAFADVHTKYERCKEIIIGYKQNEETLTGTLEKSKLAAQKYEDRYETLKAHAKAQLEKANKELAAMKEKHQMELSKLTTIIRRLEIKNGSIQQALDQKTRECAELAQLCDEMAGPAP